jgi:hypothetical protein
MARIGLLLMQCSVLTIQLCVHDGLLSQRAASDILSMTRKCVGLFRHSSAASSRVNLIGLL